MCASGPPVPHVDMRYDIDPPRPSRIYIPDIVHTFPAILIMAAEHIELFFELYTSRGAGGELVRRRATRALCTEHSVCASVWPNKLTASQLSPLV